MISVSDLSKEFGPTKAVDRISFSIEPGEVVGFLGPNGAGKSTTIRILTGFLPATRGEVSIEGFDVFHQSMEVRKRIGYLPENVPLYPELRVREFLRFRGLLKGVPRKQIHSRIETVVEQCGLKEMARKQIGALSRGYRQRVGLADALIAEPPVLILDEPTTGLDPLQRIEIRDLIRSLSKSATILFSSHILSEVESICSRVLMIHQGRIIADGTPAELMSKIPDFHQYRLVLLAPGKTSEDIRDQLLILSSVSQAQEDPRPTEPNGISMIVDSHPGTDPRQELFQLAVERGWVLLELSRSLHSLEDLFARLTLGGERA